MLTRVIDRVGRAGRGVGEPRRAVVVSTLHSPRHGYTPVVAWFWELVIGLSVLLGTRGAVGRVEFPHGLQGVGVSGSPPYRADRGRVSAGIIPPSRFAYL